MSIRWACITIFAKRKKKKKVLTSAITSLLGASLSRLISYDTYLYQFLCFCHNLKYYVALVTFANYESLPLLLLMIEDYLTKKKKHYLPY